MISRYICMDRGMMSKNKSIFFNVKLCTQCEINYLHAKIIIKTNEINMKLKRTKMITFLKA